MELQQHSTCPQPDISSYVDGELSPEREIQLEAHLAECSICTEHLKVERQFLCALNASLDGEQELDLPADFTRVVVTRAESGVSGLRRPSERFNAAFICSGLFLIVVFSLGADSTKIAEMLMTVLEKSAAVALFLLHFAYDVALGLIVILRAISSHLVSGSVESLAITSIAGIYFYLITRAAAFFHRV